jgi:Flp pilus assembly protein TadG
MLRYLSRLWRSETGNVAAMFGLAVIPIVGFVGGAVDFSHRAQVRAELQAAADAAALAGARVVQNGQLARGMSWDTLQANARTAAANVFTGDFAAQANMIAPQPVVGVDTAKVSVAATMGVQTSFLAVLGMRSLGADAYAEVSVPANITTEIAFVVDYSLSMADNDKYVRMTDAAKKFINKVATERGARTKIGIVPFSQYVYAALPGSNIRGEQATSTQTMCFLNRDYPYAASDEPPTLAIDASRWPGIADTTPECQPYVDHSLLVQDLTNDFVELSDALSAMRPTGLTNIALATEFGWQMLTPEMPFDTAVASQPDNPVVKVLILLTDGKQTVEAMGPDGVVSVEGADATATELCHNMSDSGVRIFTIGYDLDDPAARDLLMNCASSPGAFREANTSDISQVFDDIYRQIAESVWLSR